MIRTLAVIAVLLCLGVAAQADLFNMGPRLTNLEMVTVQDAGNAADNTGYGSVAYTYSIGKYEVTAGQYAAFLNAVAATDTYELYNAHMADTSYGSGITRTGASGSYSYWVASDFVNRPVNYVSWGDSARFANWLHNGQPTGAQGRATTEDGAYYLNGATTDARLYLVNRKAGWKWAITSEDEWYKAAYYKGGSAGYWRYPTSSDTAPGRDTADASGNNANVCGIPYPIDSGKYTTVVGEFQNSGSCYGTFDQGGNVWEWNEARGDGAYRGMRGGSFNSSNGCLQSAYRYYDGYYPRLEASFFGFRVSHVPEPSSNTALAVALAGVLGLRRRKA